MDIFKNIWAHPRTSAMGLLLGVVTVAGALAQQGVGLGKVGTGTWVSLVSGLATALLGLLARDPGVVDGNANPGQGAGVKLGAWMLIALLLPFPWMIGCSQTRVAQEIVDWTPALQAAVDSVASTAQALDPAGAAELNRATLGFDAAARLLKAEAQAYLTNQSAPELEKLQSAVVALEQQVNSALLAAARIENPASQQRALNTVNAVGAATLAILALVDSVSSGPQVARMRAAAPIKLAMVEGWMNRGAATDLVASHYGLSPAEASQAVARVEESEMQAGF